MTQLIISNGNTVVAEWYEPSIDEIIARLEEAYYNRSRIKTIGRQAGKDLSRKTWQATARGFYEIIKNHTLQN